MNFFFDKLGNKKKSSIQESTINKRINSCLNKKIWIPKTVYAKEIFLKNIFKTKFHLKTISILGHLHHGKSTLTNLLAASVHSINDKFLIESFSNLFFIEQEKNTTIYPNVVTLMFYSRQKKPNIFNFIDCPGHPDFHDQAITCMEISNGVILVVDLAEGVMIGTELCLKSAIIRGLPVILILNSLDRLILELNLPPYAVHLRILTVIDELNVIIQKFLKIYSFKKKQSFKYFNPLLNNVCFSSLTQGWTFTIEQFSEVYISSQPSCCLSAKDLAFLLWNCFSNLVDKNKYKLPIQKNKSFLFQDLILYPLYKLMFFSLTENYFHIKKLVEIEMGIYGFKIKDISLSSESVLNFCICLFLGGCRDTKLVYNHSGIINSINNHISSLKKSSLFQSELSHPSDKKRKIGYITKFSFQKNGKGTLALCKILNGKIKVKDKVRVVTNESFFYKNQKFFSFCQINDLMISVGRYTINLSVAPAGSLILINAFENECKKNGIFYSLFDSKLNLDFYFTATKRHLMNYGINRVIKILIKPIQISNLNNLLKALRVCLKIYPNLGCQVKLNGNVIISSSSEFYLDCVLHDLKKILDETEFQLSQPYVSLVETISHTASFKYATMKSGLMLKISKSNLRKKAKFSMLGFLLLFEKLKSKSKNFSGLLNSISGGYISSKLKEIFHMDKTIANDTWFFDCHNVHFSSCFLRGNSNLFFSKEEKQIISSYFEHFFKKGPLLSEPLSRGEFVLKKKHHKQLDFEEIYKENEQLKEDLLLDKIFTQEPIFIGDLIFPDNYFPLISRYLKMKFAQIISYDNFFAEKIILIRIRISGSMLLEVEKEILVLTQYKGEAIFLFDSWKECD